MYWVCAGVARLLLVLPTAVQTITSRIAPDVVSIKEGAWPTPGADDGDTEGCANALADDRSAPCGATCNMKQVEVAAVDRP